VLYPLSYEGGYEVMTPTDARECLWPRVVGLTSTDLVVLCLSGAIHGATGIDRSDTGIPGARVG
jgi:hypothetical protein